MDPVIQKSRWATSAIFFVNGVILSSWFPHIAVVKEKLALGEGVLGIALLATAVGALLAMPVTGVLCQKFGTRRVTTISGFAFALSLPFVAVAPDFYWLCAALLVFGAGNGSLDIAMNAQAVLVERRYGKTIMSSFHGFFSLGGLFGSGIGGYALSFGMSPLFHLIGVCCVTLFAVSIIARHMLCDPDQGVESHASFALPRGHLVWLGVIAFFVLVIEGSVGDWSAVYLRESLMTSPGHAAAGYAAFSLTMALGRLFGDRFVSGFGPVALTRATSCVAAVGLAAALLIHHPVAAVIGFACVGLGLSNLIPVLFSAAGRVPGTSSSAGIAAVGTVGYFGLLVGPPLIGFAAELSSLPMALGLLAAAAFLVLLMAPLTRVPCESNE